MTAFALTLNCLASIQQPQEGSDENGQPSTVYTEFDTTYTNIKPMSGIESIKAGAVASTVNVSIRMRYRKDLTAGMRIVFDGVKYNINAVLPDVSGRRHTDVVCEVLT